CPLAPGPPREDPEAPAPESRLNGTGPRRWAATRMENCVPADRAARTRPRRTWRSPASRPVVDSRPAARLSSVHSRSTTIEEVAMRYLCLIYDEETKLAARPKSEADAFTAEYFAFTEGIRK